MRGGWITVRVIFTILIIGILLITPKTIYAKPDISARNAIVMNQANGEIIYEKAAHDPQLIASITKMLTAIIAVESGRLSETVTISHEAAYTEGSSIYLQEGEKIKLKDLVYGLMLRSGNDAATAIAEHIGGSVEGFAFMMNEKAKWLGMENSHFDNPHGLDSDTHYSTAYDMALLTKYAMNNETFVAITGAKSYHSEKRDYAWGNKNKLLTHYYPYVIGGKTGYTKVAGRTLISIAVKNGVTLIVVTLQDPNDWQDHIRLYDWAFDQYSETTFQNEKQGFEKKTSFIHDIKVILLHMMGVW